MSKIKLYLFRVRSDEARTAVWMTFDAAAGLVVRGVKRQTALQVLQASWGRLAPPDNTRPYHELFTTVRYKGVMRPSEVAMTMAEIKAQHAKETQDDA